MRERQDRERRQWEIGRARGSERDNERCSEREAERELSLHEL